MTAKPNVLYVTSTIEGRVCAEQQAKDCAVAAAIDHLGAIAMIQYAYPPDHPEMLPASERLFSNLNSSAVVKDRLKRVAQWFTATGVIIDGNLPESRQRQILGHAEHSRMPALLLGEELTPGYIHPAALCRTACDPSMLWFIGHDIDSPRAEATLADFIAANPILVPVRTEQ